MTDPVEAVLTASSAGVSLDGLVVERTPAGYTVSVNGVASTDLGEVEATEQLREVPEHVENWAFWQRVGGVGSARRAFLRFCEHAGAIEHADDRHAALADGLERTWGQLVVRTSLTGDGDRRYSLRHERDRERPESALERVADLPTLRDLARRDESGAYRPLRTAPTLQCGWVHTDLDHETLVRAVETVYPATIANWHREREGRLDVTHWDETATRQTGIYEVVGDLPRPAVDWLAAACCDDEACVKRREWDAAAADPLEVPRGEGTIPCREPCSVAIAAARQFAIQELETEREWTTSLTRSEVGQLISLLEETTTAADSPRAGAVAEPTNQYRLRYLRAKRFGDETAPFESED